MFGVWAMRSANSVCGAAEKWCEHQGEHITFPTWGEAEGHAAHLNTECSSKNVSYEARRYNETQSLP